MSVETFIITIYCLVDDLYKKLIDTPLKRRCPSPKLSDVELLLIEIVGEWIGYHQDKSIRQYFLRHWLSLFPSIPERSQFVRQSANLWQTKILMQQYLAKELGANTDDFHFVDGFPVKVCVITRAKRSRLFKGNADFGYCASKDEYFYGFHGNFLVNSKGVPVDISFTSPKVDDRDLVPELIDNIEGKLVGDKGYISPRLKDEFLSQDVLLETPLRKNMTDKRPKVAVSLMMRFRRRIETVIGQLVHYFDIEHIKCRDLWNLTSRI